MDTSHWVLLGFLFVLGTIVGSFLNVVVYRLPRGENLMYPPSRCPECGKAIRWHDNGLAGDAVIVDREFRFDIQSWNSSSG